MKTFKQSQITILILLVLMIFSTFIAVPVNGGDKGWWSVWGLEVTAYRSIFHLPGEVNPMDPRLLIFAVSGLVHIIIIVFPFLINNNQFSRLLYWVPLLYLSLTAVGLVYFLIFLIPFAILWSITALMWHRLSKQQLEFKTGQQIL